jgi:hypothetical protein
MDSFLDSEGHKIERCFYVPEHTSIVDLCRADENGIERSVIYGKTLEEIQETYPGARAYYFNVACDEIDEAEKREYCKPPEEISEERFHYFLEVVPPIKYKQTPDGCTFKVGELVSGAIATICAYVAGKYFVLTDDVNLTHEEILSRCQRG